MWELFTLERIIRLLEHTHSTIYMKETTFMYTCFIENEKKVGNITHAKLAPNG